MIFNKTKFLFDFFQQKSILFQKTIKKAINDDFKVNNLIKNLKNFM